jgi:hypothetical protein
MLGGVLRPGEVLPLDDALDLAWMLVGLGKAYPPHKWVPELIEQARAAKWEAIGVR